MVEWYQKERERDRDRERESQEMVQNASAVIGIHESDWRSIKRPGPAPDRILDTGPKQMNARHHPTLIWQQSVFH